MELTIAILLILALGAAAFFLFKKLKKSQEDNKQLNASLEAYRPIIDIESALSVKNKELEVIQKAAEELREKYHNGKELLTKLERDINLFESDLDTIDFGIYKPIFNLDDSEAYKLMLTEIVNRQKDFIQRERAAICTTTWTVEGSEAKGRAMIRQYIKLTLRAFNGEADSLIAKVKWNNIARFEERLKRAHEAINKLGKSNHVHITDDYLQLKLDELHLVHELEVKKYEEKEEQRQIREQMREEEKAQRELERAQREAEDEEKRFEKALEQAQKKLEKAQGKELDQLSNQILELQRQLEQAHEAKERAISRAQMTRSGHVYIISNIGSFGENRYKIGMTRRLEPMDRVKELGDASVPFEFDVHAMIYSEDAPGLENTLHKIFNEKRVNMVNYRKEFFNVSLQEIEEAIKENTDAEFHITKAAEAKEYRETLSILTAPIQAETKAPQVAAYPDAIF
ncbi:DUF4041 domain-containing protein [Pontibacter korlensis]|uniref:Chromosome partitioning protein ParA n=1 Tax=Pontibacter korlensis TaxID=400092 RepID=A0A0E3ZFM4_9BACT|nr:DUF4041 domain-containing protein [Pontibacter korlensis]AKD04370.1 chromosome partitioning protein ParA [Pontibacter korlensis]